MLKIRLARAGRRKLPFFRVVLTEHTKSPKGGYQQVLGWYDPIKHITEINTEAVKKFIAQGAKPSERVAKIAFKKTGDDFFKAYYTERTRTKAVRNPDKFS